MGRYVNVKKKATYYDIREDLEIYPDMWCYCIYSKRGPGKTYSTLSYCIEENIKFIFLKLTNDDVKIMCEGHHLGKAIKKEYQLELSPFKPLNRDKGWNIFPFLLFDGLGAFYHTEVTEEGICPSGEPVGYIVSASSVSKVKGFDMSECDIMIYDEFIPKSYDIIRRGTGDAILDLYLTISRDRLKRGRKELKLIMLANATEVNNHMFIALDLVDLAADMDIKGIEYQTTSAGILLHQIPEDKYDTLKHENGEKSGIEKATENTPFGRMAFGGHFAYNDFSSVGKVNIRKCSCICSFIYRNKQYYVYLSNGMYQVTRVPQRLSKDYIFDLAKENAQKRFKITEQIDLYDNTVMDKVVYCDYSSYDLIMNYNKIFKL